MNVADDPGDDVVAAAVVEDADVDVAYFLNQLSYDCSLIVRVAKDVRDHQLTAANCILLVNTNYRAHHVNSVRY